MKIMSFLKSSLYKISLARQNSKNRMAKQAVKIQFVKIENKEIFKI